MMNTPEDKACRPKKEPTRIRGQTSMTTTHDPKTQRLLEAARALLAHLDSEAQDPWGFELKHKALANAVAEFDVPEPKRPQSLQSHLKQVSLDQLVQVPRLAQEEIQRRRAALTRKAGLNVAATVAYQANLDSFEEQLALAASRAPEAQAEHEIITQLKARIAELEAELEDYHEHYQRTVEWHSLAHSDLVFETDYYGNSRVRFKTAEERARESAALEPTPEATVSLYCNDAGEWIADYRREGYRWREAFHESPAEALRHLAAHLDEKPE